MKTQYARAERIQGRAEAIQVKSTRLAAGSRKVLAVVLQVIIVPVIYLTWILFRR